MLNCTAHQRLASRAARRAIVLLKNDAATLPLRSGPGSRIAVIGPLSEMVCEDWYSGTMPYQVTAADGLREAIGALGGEVTGVKASTGSRCGPHRGTGSARSRPSDSRQLLEARLGTGSVLLDELTTATSARSRDTFGRVAADGEAFSRRHGSLPRSTWTRRTACSQVRRSLMVSEKIAALRSGWLLVTVTAPVFFYGHGGRRDRSSGYLGRRTQNSFPHGSRITQ